MRDAQTDALYVKKLFPSQSSLCLISHEIMQKFNCTENVAFHEAAFVAFTTMLPICTNCVEKFTACTEYTSESITQACLRRG